MRMSVSRRGVVRVGGVNVGALPRDLNGEENGMMVMMQIVDANESQNWINGLRMPSLASGAHSPGCCLRSPPFS
jgi:hypothetical protein